jgi:hypothetical protein
MQQTTGAVQQTNTDAIQQANNHDDLIHKIYKGDNPKFIPETKI